MDELGMLEGHGEAITQPEARVARGEEWDLVSRFYLALARHAHDLIGRPVLVYESMLMPEEEQLARQGGRGQAAADPLAGLDVIVSIRVDEHRIAAVWRTEEGEVVASGSVGHTYGATPIGRWAELGSDPIVLDRLPGRRGQVFEHDVLFDGLPRLWPVQAPPGARLVQRGGGTEVLEACGWRIAITAWGLSGSAAGEVAHELGIEEASVPARPLAGSVLGRRHGFELASHGGVWAAVATCGAFVVTVEGRGKPPARLDLELLESN